MKYFLFSVRPVAACEYNEVSVSPDMTGYVQQCLGPHVPSTHIFSLTDNRCLVTLDTNTHIHRQLAVSSMPRLMEFSLPLSSSSAALARVKLTLPPVLREDEDFAFPLLVNM